MKTGIALLIAALLETSGIASARIGLGGRREGLVAGAVLLFAYGIVVNLGRFDFGRLIGVYIAVFFTVSQAVAFAIFHLVPAPKTIAGGALIVIGGVMLAIG
jgi:hypothetical protein